jgi:T5SS/PEP-CTERM-associated repeat protein
MKLILILGLAISLGRAQECVADSYYWEGVSSGIFSSPNWLDTTAGGGGGPGPPGAGDSADAGSADLTLNSGSVMELQGEGATFDVEGQFSAGSLEGDETILGSGLLTATSVSASLEIEGGNVSATAFASPETYVDSGGTLTVSGSITDHCYLECSGVGSMITAQGRMTDVGLMLGPGGQVTTTGIVNLLGSSCNFQGSGALVSDSGDLDLGEGATLNVLSNATLQVSGDANLDGGTNISDGGATWSDPQTSVQVDGTLNVGYNYGSFYLDILNGAQVTSGSSYIGAAGRKGYVTVSDSNTLWNVQPGGLLVGSVTPGSLTINGGAGLAFATGAPFAIAWNSNSPGMLQLDDPGSYINASAIPVEIGVEAGSQGTAEIGNLATMQVGGDFFVGDGVTGTLTLSSAQLNLISAANRFDLGHQAGAYGSVELSDGATLTNQGYTTVGDAGGGYLAASGSTMKTSGTTVGNTNGSTGTASISSSNAYWLETNELIVASLPNSTGTVYVTSQAVLKVPGACLVGNGGNGNFYIQSGGSCLVPDGPNNKFGVGNTTEAPDS